MFSYQPLSRRLRWALLPSIIASSGLLGCGESSLGATIPVATVTGAICDTGAKRFVPGARVRLLEQDRTGKVVKEQETTTDDEGKFKFTPVMSGSHIVRADKAAFQTELAVQVTRDQDVQMPVPDCVLPTGSLKGRICDQQAGAWLDGATVTIQGPTGLVSAAEPTNVLGEFSIVGVPAGTRRVTASKGGKTFTYDVRIPADGEGDLGVTDCVLSGLSNIEGQICANEAGIWLAGATVSVTDAADSIVTETDVDGQFVLRAVPPGTHHIKVEKGAFVVEFDIATEANKTKKLDAPVCTPSGIAIAVVSGNFDATQKVLARLKFSNVVIYMGYDGHNEVKDLQANFDGNWVTHLLDGPSPGIFNYRIAVFNSGLDMDLLGPPGSAARNQRLLTLRKFVSDGGFVYISDWAFELIAAGFGAPLDFHGPDNNPESTRVALDQTIEGARIVAPHLQQILGSDRIDLTITLPQMAVVDRALGDATVYMSGDVALPGNLEVRDAPLLASFPVGSGRVVFTSLFRHFAADDVVNKVLTFLIFEL